MNTNALSDIFTLDSQLIAMLDAVSRGAMVPGCADITIRAYDERLHITLPDAPCIYIYALCNPAQTVPYALYIGQSLRHAAVRLDEHLRQCKTAADRYMREELDAGNALRVVVLCAPADALNELERTGYRWLMEHVYSARIMNAAMAGANHCVRGAGDNDRAPVTLHSVMDYGASVARFPLALVSDELDALENALTPDALRDLDALAALNIPFGLQAVSVSVDGAAHILVGAPVMLAARRSGRDEAFGAVTVVRAKEYAGGDLRVTVEALCTVRDLKRTLPKAVWRTIRALIVQRRASQCAKAGAATKRVRPVEELARLLVPECPHSDSRIRELYSKRNYVIMHESAYDSGAHRDLVMTRAPERADNDSAIAVCTMADCAMAAL